MVIAIDGPAGAGKSTVARAVAGEIGFTYLDSGAMYRCVALAALWDGTDLDDGEALGALAEGLDIGFDGSRGGSRVLLGEREVTGFGGPGGGGGVLPGGRGGGGETRPPGASAAAPRAPVHPCVREAMVARQRQLITAGRYVAEGRDIGTVVSPEAPLKIFLTATPEERARRRAAQTGEDPAAVLAAQRERDARDETREHSALRAAEDAIEIDTTGLALDEVVDRVESLVRERRLA